VLRTDTLGNDGREAGAGLVSPFNPLCTGASGLRGRRSLPDEQPLIVRPFSFDHPHLVIGFTELPPLDDDVHGISPPKLVSPGGPRLDTAPLTADPHSIAGSTGSQQTADGL